jgi:hypothetical protein
LPITFGDAPGHLHRLVGGLDATDELDELHAVGRVEKVHRDAPPRTIRRGGDLRRAHGRGVRREYRPRLAQLVEPSEEVELQVHLLQHRLYNEFRPEDRLLQIFGGREAVQGFLHLPLLEPTLLDGLSHLLLDAARRVF